MFIDAFDIAREEICKHFILGPLNYFMNVLICVCPDNIDSLNPLLNCLSSIENWMNSNSLKLNQDKTEILIIGTDAQRLAIMSMLGNLSSQVKSTIQNLGVILDPDLNFEKLSVMSPEQPFIT